MGATLPGAAEASFSKKIEELIQRYASVRWATEALCATLENEDYVVQSMPEASPAKWHLAHTTWFFETFVLGEAEPNYRIYNSQFSSLFNSYYVQAGDRWNPAQKGMLARPTVRDVYAYRAHVDQAMQGLFEHDLVNLEPHFAAQLLDRIELGINHAQRHQELLVADIQHAFYVNPLRPVFREQIDEGCLKVSESVSAPAEWIEFKEGLRMIGHDGAGFSYDIEKPRHRQFVPGFQLASRTVTCGEYLEFIDAKGYQRPELWLAAGWDARESNQWQAPLYWELGDAGTWEEFTLNGMRQLDANDPVAHLSYYEADAYARWRGCTLPTEAMWETACVESAPSADEGLFAESACFHPVITAYGPGLQQMLGNVWEWTSSPFAAYSGYTMPHGALGEYNGKFMCGQMVLRGGSCATPRTHIRPTYRKYLHPNAQWQFAGVRLARVHTD